MGYLGRSNSPIRWGSGEDKKVSIRPNKISAARVTSVIEQHADFRCLVNASMSGTSAPCGWDSRRCAESTRYFPSVDAPSSQGVLQCFDQIACVHMSGLFVRSHMNAGQDGFRDKSSKQKSDLIEGHWKMRSFSRRGSIDHTICSLSCKFWHQFSTVTIELLPVSG
jgi:hypothetical protein